MNKAKLVKTSTPSWYAVAILLEKGTLLICQTSVVFASGEQDAVKQACQCDDATYKFMDGFKLILKSTCLTDLIENDLNLNSQ